VETLILWGGIHKWLNKLSNSRCSNNNRCKISLQETPGTLLIINQEAEVKLEINTDKKTITREV